MAITHVVPQPDRPDEVHYSVPDSYPRAARRVRQLLILALLTSMWSAGSNAILAVDAHGATMRIQDSVIALADQEQLVSKALEDPRTIKALTGQETPLEPDEVRLLLSQANGASSILVQGVSDLMLLFMALTVYFPVKYLILYVRVGAGNPNTYRSLRTTATLQLALEVGRLLLVYDMTRFAYDLEVPNPISFTAVIAVLMLLYLRTSDLRSYFSEYRLVRDEPAAQPSAT